MKIPILAVSLELYDDSTLDDEEPSEESSMVRRDIRCRTTRKR